MCNVFLSLAPHLPSFCNKLALCTFFSFSFLSLSLWSSWWLIQFGSQENIILLQFLSVHNYIWLLSIRFQWKQGIMRVFFRIHCDNMKFICANCNIFYYSVIILHSKLFFPFFFYLNLISRFNSGLHVLFHNSYIYVYTNWLAVRYL